MPKPYEQVVYAEHSLSSCESGMEVRARQRLPVWLAPHKTPGHRVCNEPPW